MNVDPGGNEIQRCKEAKIQRADILTSHQVGIGESGHNELWPYDSMYEHLDRLSSS
jgi:hypothetical protein